MVVLPRFFSADPPLGKGYDAVDQKASVVFLCQPP
jgi:hypothetical protein